MSKLIDNILNNNFSRDQVVYWLLVDNSESLEVIRNINALDEFDKTALYYAYEQKNELIFDLLLSNNAKDIGGNIFELICGKKDDYIFGKLVLSKAIMVENLDQSLAYAYKRRLDELYESLISQGARANNYVIKSLCKNAEKDLIIKLIDNKAIDLNKTLTYYCKLNKNDEVTTYLVNQGAIIS